MTFRLLIFCLWLSSSLALAQQDANPKPDLPTVPQDTLPDILEWGQEQLGFSNLPTYPAENPMTAEKIELGRKLFFDPLLSLDNSVACASCHQPEDGFASSEKVAVGIEGKLGTRNAPTVLNRGFGKHFSWDGKSDSLEAQVLVPLTNPNELGNASVEQVVNRLRQNAEYGKLFAKVFASDQADSVGNAEVVNAENLSKAIAAFERALVYGDSKVDKFRNAEYTALSREARQGMWIFESRGGCWKCHSGENFTDEDFHNTGVSFKSESKDVGRFEQTKNTDDRFKFKTPTLRGVGLTAPYMHDGSVTSLKEVVQFYNEGGSPDDSGLDKDMKPLNLTDEEVGFLVEFLKALSQ